MTINYLKTLVFIVLSIFTTTIDAQESETVPTKTLKLLFVGDIMGHSPQITSAYDTATQTYNYSPCFQYVKPIIEQADLAIGNLEVTLPGKKPYTGYPIFKSPDALATAVKEAGFDVIVTANNHSNDGRLKGLTHTIDVLRDLKIHQTGTFKNEAEKAVYYPLMVYKNGFKLAFLNYTYSTNGIPTPKPAMVNWIDEEQIKKDIGTAKVLRPDAIIVMMHWGLEYKINESPVQQDLAKKIFNWGADLVIGAHPHVVQPIKETKNAAGKKGVVAYSLGNFISNQQYKNTDGGLIFEIELQKEANKRELNHKLINLMITKIPNESKYCVSYGQLKGCYWTIPATSTQGTTKEGDKDYIARVALSANMNLELHKKVFLEFVESRQNSKRLFPDYGYGRTLGRWFNESFLVKLGLKTPSLVFHSFRHTMVTRLGQADVTQPVYQSIIGHARSGVTQEVYLSEGFTLKQLKDGIECFHV